MDRTVTTTSSSEGTGESKYTDHERLMKKVQKMNARSEKAREAMSEQYQGRIQNLHKEISRLCDQIGSLPANSDDENIRAYRDSLKQRREKLYEQLEHTKRKADPASQGDEFKQQLQTTDAEYHEKRRDEEKRFHEAAKSVLRRRTMMTDGTVKHDKGWDPDLRAGNYIYRRQVGLGDDDPEKLKSRHLPWTKFDFKYGKDRPPFRLRFETGKTFGERLPKKEPPPIGTKKASSMDEVLSKTKRQPPWHYPHSKPWVLGNESAYITFSEYESDKPRSAAELREAATALIPDRVFYDPEKYGRPGWKDPEVSVGTGLFQTQEHENAFRQKKQDEERRRRWRDIGLDPDEAEPEPYIKERKNALDPKTNIPNFPLYEETTTVGSTGKSQVSHEGKQRSRKPSSQAANRKVQLQESPTQKTKKTDMFASSSSSFASSRGSRSRKQEKNVPQRTALNTFGDALRMEAL
eukprot:gb/GECG01008473.1/.p1 GENE.gb/GECG01008473.1/~~gb/GECG01008473.1/.p1  ORF type:complete len:464 (+),score=82.88 gb/GECG01008473.1/:1-1392(+)